MRIAISERSPQVIKLEGSGTSTRKEICSPFWELQIQLPWLRLDASYAPVTDALLQDREVGGSNRLD